MNRQQDKKDEILDDERYVLENFTPNFNLFNDSVNSVKQNYINTVQNIHNFTVEASILACFIVRPNLFSQNTLLSTDFFFNEHKQIFHTMKEIFEEQHTIDGILLLDRIESKFEHENSVQIIKRIMSMSINTSNFEQYVQIVKLCSARRHVFDVGEQLIRLSSEKLTLDQLFNKVEILYSTLLNSPEEKVEYSNLHSLNEQIIGSLTGPKVENKIKTGFDLFDNILMGFRPTEITVIAARPGVGKTTLSLSLALQIAKNNKKILFLSLEMSKEQLALRTLSNLNKINSMKLSNSEIDKNQLKSLIAHHNTDKTTKNIWISDLPNMNLRMLQKICRQSVANLGVDIIIVDYMQLISVGKNTYEHVRHEEIAQITIQIKNLARELKLPIIVLSQLSRESEKSKDRKPMLWHLKSSGALEEHFDNIILIHKTNEEDKIDSIYEQVDILSDNEYEEVEIILAKHRNGPVGTKKMKFSNSFSAFYDIE